MKAQISYDNIQEILTIPYEQLAACLEAIREAYLALKGFTEKCELEPQSQELKQLRDATEADLLCKVSEFKTLLRDNKNFQEHIKKDELCKANKKTLKKEITKEITKLSADCNLSPSLFKKEYDEQIVEFRILDGILYPYYKMCVGGQGDCKQSKAGSLLMPTQFGTLTVSDTINNKFIGSGYTPALTFVFNELGDNDEMLYMDELGDFIDLAFKAYINQKDLVLPVSRKLYSVLNIHSIESQEPVELTPMKIVLNQAAIAEKAAEFVKVEGKSEYIPPSSLNVIYRAEILHYKCIKKVVTLSNEKTYYSISHDASITQDGETLPKTSSAPAIDVSYDASLETLDYLLSSNLEYRINQEPSVNHWMKVEIPTELAEVIIHNRKIPKLDINNDYVEIIIDVVVCPSVGDSLFNIIASTADGYKYDSDKKLPLNEELSLTSDCAVYLGYSGTSTAIHNDHDTTSA